MKFIGDRISYQSKEGVFSIVIAASVSKIKETLLITWLLAWTGCGIYFFYQLFLDLPRDNKLFIVVLLTFWAYYEFKGINIFMWRKFGYESIKVFDDKLVLKDSVQGRGKAREFFLDNIVGLSKLDMGNTWVQTMDQSFWVKGNGNIQFQYLGKIVTFGKQLTDDETDNLLTIIRKQTSIKN